MKTDQLSSITLVPLTKMPTFNHKQTNNACIKKHCNHEAICKLIVMWTVNFQITSKASVLQDECAVYANYLSSTMVILQLSPFPICQLFQHFVQQLKQIFLTSLTWQCHHAPVHDDYQFLNIQNCDKICRVYDQEVVGMKVIHCSLLLTSLSSLKYSISRILNTFNDICQYCVMMASIPMFNSVGNDAPAGYWSRSHCTALMCG